MRIIEERNFPIVKWCKDIVVMLPGDSKGYWMQKSRRLYGNLEECFNLREQREIFQDLHRDKRVGSKKRHEISQFISSSCYTY